ncbi:MAG: N-6 DNA methylase [Lachnospiraceae bacterium]
MERKQLKSEIINAIEKLSGKYAPYQVFRDWIELSALSLYNSSCMLHDELWKEREERYINTAKKYTKEEINDIVSMNGMLTLLMDAEIRDWLGEIYMESGCGNKGTGQFFTPWHISRMTAQIQLSTQEISENSIITLNEPSTGGGGMMIAAVDILLEMGINPQKVLRVVAQDLDWIGVYMTYIQLSILGIDAIVVQGDTIAEPYKKGYPEERVMRTPKNMGLLFWQ